MKKIWSLCIAFSIAFSLAACGGRSVNDTEDINSIGTVAPVEAPNTSAEENQPNEEPQIGRASGDITVSAPADDEPSKEMKEECIFQVQEENPQTKRRMVESGGHPRGHYFKRGF